ncbi:MAG: ABC transporter permease [Bacteroides sp.]|nr:ABC transporter permease [Bacteroides sp.]
MRDKNMTKNYLQRLFRMLREDKLFSSIYISGTALSIAFTMVMAISYYVKLAPIYPEVNRMHTYYLKFARFREKQDETSFLSGYSRRAAEEWFYKLENVEAVSMERNSDEGGYVRLPDKRGDLHVTAKFTDPAFFRIYALRFLEGGPLSEADFESGALTAVISDKLAKVVFGHDKGVVGQTLRMSYKDYRICGVVEEASTLAESSYAQVYVAYDKEVDEGMGGRLGPIPYMGEMEATVLVKSEEQADALREELADITRRYNASQDAYQLELLEQPISHFRSVFMLVEDRDFFDSEVVCSLILILCVLLIVPGINLCGVIAGRMESRVAEMGG